MTTLVNHETGEVLDTIGVEKARRLTTEAQNEFASSSAHHARGWAIVEEAILGGGHLDLGYRSPGDYIHTEFDGVLSGLDVPSRRVAAREMRTLGISTRDAAKVLGVSNFTVSKDRAGVSSLTPDDTSEPGRVGLSGSEHTEGEASPEPASETKVGPSPAPRPPIVGRDGKTYTPPAPRAKSREEIDQEELERGRRDTCTRIAECVRFLDGGDEYAAIFLRDFYPHEDRFLADGMRLTPARVSSAIDFLSAIAKELGQ